MLAALPIAGLAAALLLACAAKPVERDRSYRLDPPPLVGPSGAPAPVVLEVSHLDGSGFIGGRPILYRTREQPLSIQRYALFLWEEPPSQALSAALARAIRSAGPVQHVVTPADRARADYRIAGEVTRFEHLPTDLPPRVAVAFDLTLVRADTRMPLVNRGYAGEEPVGGSTPEDMVEAFERLTARLIGEVVTDLAAKRTSLVPVREP